MIHMKRLKYIYEINKKMYLIPCLLISYRLKVPVIFDFGTEFVFTYNTIYFSISFCNPIYSYTSVAKDDRLDAALLTTMGVKSALNSSLLMQPSINSSSDKTELPSVSRLWKTALAFSAAELSDSDVREPNMA